MLTILPNSVVGRSQEIVQWCAEHGVNGHEVWKIEVDENRRWATFYRYETTGGVGARVRFAMNVLGRIQHREPWTVQLKRMPPTEEQVLEARHKKGLLKWG